MHQNIFWCILIIWMFFMWYNFYTKRKIPASIIWKMLGINVTVIILVLQFLIVLVVSESYSLSLLSLLLLSNQFPLSSIAMGHETLFSPFINNLSLFVVEIVTLWKAMMISQYFSTNKAPRWWQIMLVQIRY